MMMTVESWFSLLTALPHDLDNVCLYLLKDAVASIGQYTVQSVGRIIILS